MNMDEKTYMQITSIGGFMTPITVASVVAVLKTQGITGVFSRCSIHTAMKT